MLNSIKDRINKVEIRHLQHTQIWSNLESLKEEFKVWILGPSRLPHDDIKYETWKIWSSTTPGGPFDKALGAPVIGLLKPGHWKYLWRLPGQGTTKPHVWSCKTKQLTLVCLDHTKIESFSIRIWNRINLLKSFAGTSNCDESHLPMS